MERAQKASRSDGTRAAAEHTGGIRAPGVLADLSPRGERLGALAQLAQADVGVAQRRPAVVQRDAEDSPGLNRVRNEAASAKGKGGADFKSQALADLVGVGKKRFGDLAPEDERKQAERGKSNFEMIEAHEFGIVKTECEPLLQESAEPKDGAVLVRVVTRVFNRSLKLDKGKGEGYEVQSWRMPGKKGLVIGYFDNTFVTKDGAIAGMTAGNNYISPDEGEQLPKLKVFMNEAVIEQYEAVRAWLIKGKAKAGGIALPFSILRQPATGTKLAAALTAPGCQRGGGKPWTTDGEFAALGSQHGTLAYRLCLDMGLSHNNLAITFPDGGNPLYTLSP